MLATSVFVTKQEARVDINNHVFYFQPISTTRSSSLYTQCTAAAASRSSSSIFYYQLEVLTTTVYQYRRVVVVTYYTTTVIHQQRSSYIHIMMSKELWNSIIYTQCVRRRMYMIAYMIARYRESALTLPNTIRWFSTCRHTHRYRVMVTFISIDHHNNIISHGGVWIQYISFLLENEITLLYNLLIFVK